MIRGRTATRLALGGLVLLAATARAAEPFYLGLMEAGSREYLRGDYPAAAKKLRIASFGLLDDPQLLTRGLVRLALAQAGAGDEAGFEATFDRLLEVEAAFGSYTRLRRDTPFKAEFERLLPQHFSAAELEAIPAFAAVAARMREATLVALPPKRLRRELERRLAADPEDGEALVLLTRLEISQDREDRAEQRIVELLAVHPENRMARCLHGQMKLRRGDCASAMEDLSWCSQPPADEVLGARYLRCLVQAADWQAAGGYLASLPMDLRSSEEVANLILAIPPDALDTLTRARAGRDDEPRDPEPFSTPSDPAFDELRYLVETATTREELDRLFVRVTEQANGRPDNRELQFLAAEVAYRRAEYALSVRFFRRGGTPGPERPLLSFYLAVGLFETGETREAAEVLAATLPRLERTPFVERYRALILGPPPTG